MAKPQIKNSIATENEIASATCDRILKQAREVESALDAFSQDAEVLMWACEQLWHHEFSARGSNEKLSLVPAAIVRLIVAASAQIHQKSTELFTNDEDRYYGDGEGWFNNVASKIQQGA